MHLLKFTWKMNIKSVHKLRSGYCFNPHFRFTACTVWISATCCGGYVLKSLFVQIVYFITSSSHTNQAANTNINVRIKSNKKECLTTNFTCDDLLMDKNAFLPSDFFALPLESMTDVSLRTLTNRSFFVSVATLRDYGWRSLFHCDKMLKTFLEHKGLVDEEMKLNQIDIINSRLFFIHVFFRVHNTTSFHTGESTRLTWTNGNLCLSSNNETRQ